MYVHTLLYKEKSSMYIPSPGARVVLIGDAAYAIPPTVAQGANQTLEDSFTLAMMLERVSEREEGAAAPLRHWHTYRQERVKQVYDLTMRRWVEGAVAILSALRGCVDVVRLDLELIAERYGETKYL